MRPSLLLPATVVEVAQAASLGSRRPVRGVRQDPKRRYRIGTILCHESKNTCNV